MKKFFYQLFIAIVIINILLVADKVLFGTIPSIKSIDYWFIIIMGVTLGHPIGKILFKYSKDDEKP